MIVKRHRLQSTIIYHRGVVEISILMTFLRTFTLTGICLMSVNDEPHFFGLRICIPTNNYIIIVTKRINVRLIKEFEIILLYRYLSLFLHIYPKILSEAEYA